MMDIMLDSVYNLLFANGDLVVANAEQQHQQLLLDTAKGDWKENPTVGVGAATWLKDHKLNGLTAEVKKEFERDGMRVENVTVTDGELKVNAHY